MSLPEKQVLKTKICSACGLKKSLTSFYKKGKLSEEYEARCKICRYNRVKQLKGIESILERGRPKQDAPQLWNVRRSDWIETFEFLKKIGYNLSGDKTIHEQFCEKYGLNPKKRTYEKSIQYTTKDLGLV